MEALSEDDDEDEEGVDGILAKLVGDGPKEGDRDRAKAELVAYAKRVRERQAQTWIVVKGTRGRKMAKTAKRAAQWPHRRQRRQAENERSSGAPASRRQCRGNRHLQCQWVAGPTGIVGGR